MEEKEHGMAGDEKLHGLSSTERDQSVELGTSTVSDDAKILEGLGYKAELHRNRSMYTLLFQSLAIAAIPYGEGSPLISAIYGGGPLSIFVGWIIVLILDECVAISLGELASRYPTSAGPYYWSYQLAPANAKILLSYVTGWVWLVGNWTITLSVNFGFASLIYGTVAMYQPDWVAQPWQLLLIFYAICLATLAICMFGNKFLPMIDTICAAWTALSILIILIALSVEAGSGRNSAAYALGGFDNSLSGWGNFGFLIGLLPAAYTFSAIGMISAMAEECASPATQVPKAIALAVPVGGFAGLFFVLPICFTLPPLEDILNFSVGGQALPYIFATVMGSPGGGLGLMFLVLAITVFCSVSITVAASRCTWAFARDDAIPFHNVFSKVDKRLGVPVNALILVTVLQMLLGLINLGSTTAFTAFVSVGVQALALSYAIPTAVSLWDKRRQVMKAPWNAGSAGLAINIVALLWITFELVLFSMPTTLPTTAASMNYSSVILVGFIAFAAVWYAVYARKAYKGPPATHDDGLAG